MSHLIHTYGAFSTNIFNLNLIMRKHQTNPVERDSEKLAYMLQKYQYYFKKSATKAMIGTI